MKHVQEPDQSTVDGGPAPVVFTVRSSQVRRVLAVLDADLQSNYLAAWRDAVTAVMDDCGWTYEEPQLFAIPRVQRLRTGRPRVLQAARIERRLVSAVRAVDNVLTSIIGEDPALLAAVVAERVQEPTVFEWQIAETRDDVTVELVGSRYIDLTPQSSSVRAD